MTTVPWQTFGSVASTAGITTIAVGTTKSALAAYQTYISPYTALTETEKRLERVRSRLKGLTREERAEIEIATRRESFSGTSLETLEEKLQDLTKMHCRLSVLIEESTFTDRHFPYSEFRVNLSNFERHAKALLSDTMKTTVPYEDDVVFNLENSRRNTERSSSAKSTFNPEIPMQAMERSSSSKSASNPENSRWAMKGSSISESLEDWKTARESFSDLGDVPLSPGRMV